MRPTVDWSFFLLALGAYGVFLVLAVLTRIGKGKTPLASFHRLHFRLALVYIIAATVCWLEGPRPLSFTVVGDFLIGLFTYFGLHHAIIANFFGLAQASVSTSIISIIHAHGGRATRAQCKADYAGGLGFGYIKRSRMSRLNNLLGWVDSRDNRLSLTWAGVCMVRFTNRMLAIWNLKQLGTDR